MNLGELTQKALAAMQAAHFKSATVTADAQARAAVLAVLAEVRQCVPGPRVRLRDSAQEAEHGFDQCRAEMLRRLNELEQQR